MLERIICTGHNRHRGLGRVHMRRPSVFNGEEERIKGVREDQEGHVEEVGWFTRDEQEVLEVGLRGN